MLRKRLAMVSVALVSTMALLAGCGGLGSGSGGKSVTVGSKDFTENILMGEVVATLIEKTTDVKVNRKLNLGGTTVNFDGIRGGDIDMYVEYDGTAYGLHLGHEDPITDPNALYDQVKREFEEKWQLTWSGPFGFNNTYAIAMPGDLAAEHGIKSISDLASKSNLFTFGTTNEFIGRTADGFDPFVSTYGITFGDVKTMAAGLRYRALETSEIQVLDAYATDAKLPEFGLVVLEDDKQFFPPYNAGVMVRMDTVEKFPEVMEAINKLAGKMTDEMMQQLNYAVEVEGKSEKAVAEAFLKDLGLIN